MDYGSNIFMWIEMMQVSTSMNDLCFDVFGTSKEKKDPKTVKGNRGNTC